MINGEKIISFIPVIAIIYLTLVHSLLLNGNGKTKFLLKEKNQKVSIQKSLLLESKEYFAFKGRTMGDRVIASFNIIHLSLQASGEFSINEPKTFLQFFV